MPKAIYDNFLGGLSPVSDNRGGEGSYAESRDIDSHRDVGYLMPGWIESNKSSSASTVATFITDAIVDKGSTNVYAVGEGKVHKIAAGTSFTDDATWPHAFTGASHIVNYPIGTTDYIFATGDTDIMRLDPTGPTFIDDYLTNGSYLNSSFNTSTGADHLMLEWEGILWIADGRYLNSLDGSSGAYGTWTSQELDLKEGWKVTALFPTRNYIGICASQDMSAGSAYRTRSAVFFWDGNSESWNYSIPIEDNEITAAFNDGGRVYLVTTGRGFGSTLRRLTETGDIPLKQFKTYIDGSVEYFYCDYPNAIDVFQNRVLVGARSGTTGRHAVFAYGSPQRGVPEALSNPYSASDDGSSSAGVGFLGQLIRGSIFIAAKDASNKYWMRFTGNYSTRALWKGLYTEPNQRVRINYTKCFFKDIDVADQDSNKGDVTVTLEVDDNTSVSLWDNNGNTTVKHANDGAITTKKFTRVEKSICDRFRPVLEWTSGATAFYKIVVDYDPVPDA